MTPAQQKLMQQVVQDFNNGSWAAAVAELRVLRMQMPNDTRLAKFEAEATINTGDRAGAKAILLPIEKAQPDDWQAASLLARIYAEERQDAQRDAELAKVTKLHTEKADAQIAKLNQILLERDVTAKGSVRIWYSLEPWGRYKTYVFARLYDADGKETGEVTLESSDFDQPMYAKEHPKEAAAGSRRFSMDGYGRTTLANGTVSQTHATYGFYDGQPAYDTVRDRILTIAGGDGHPISTSTAPAKPATP
jgi:hypothetical protein